MTLRSVALLAAVAAVVSIGRTPRAQACGNAIVCENNLPGNPESEWDVSGSGDSTLQGFTTDISVNKGGTIHFKVSTTAASFTIDIYRLGYYGGMGARKVATINNVTGGRSQPACLTNAATLLVDCGNWSEVSNWPVPSSAVSGVYIAKLTRSDTGGASHVPFIVRDDASHSDIVMQASDTTWQAYNQYGGNSLYLGNPQRAYKVSYNRPWSTRGQSGGFGPSDWIFEGEYLAIRWLESNGYDVTYSTGVDTDRNGALIRNHKAFLSIGHDEYWSGPQRANVEAARNAGVSLAFFSGNEMFWKVRWENSIDGSGTAYRTLVCYKDSSNQTPLDPANPPTWTGTWRDPRYSPPGDGNKPENAVTGQLFTVNRGTAAIQVPSAYSAMRFWRNTAIAQLQPGQTATLATQTLGYEWDEDIDNGFRPAGAMQLSSTTVSGTDHLVDQGATFVPETATHHLMLYRHASGALVFGAGTVQWLWGLDPNHDTGPDSGSPTADRNIQQATMNLFADMGLQPLTPMADMITSPASTDVAPPASIVASPLNGTAVAAGSLVTISGTAADTGGGVVGGVEVSVDGGTTWHRADGRENWTYTWRPGVTGPATIKSRAADDSGNIEAPGTGTAVTVGAAVCPCTLFTDLDTPWNITENDANQNELGVKFRADVNGLITGLRFYKSPSNTGTHTGHLWSSAGTLLGSLTFANETASGWQSANFSVPVAITANTVYVASYHTNVGFYSSSNFYFGRSGVDQGPLHALSNVAGGGNGVFNYGASSFPTQTFQAENYWVDVVLGPVDTTPPTVSVTAPGAGSTIIGTVSVSASASDNTGVAGVQFKLDGANLGAEVTAAPYTISWNSAGASNGNHTLTAVARDAAANTATSAGIAVTVNNPDTIPPTVAMSAPAAGAIVNGSAVTVSANASDNNGVVGVQFLLDGAALGAEATASPYSVTWNTTATTNGAHTLSARARDAAGNAATSAGVIVTVGNGVPIIDVNVSTDKNNKQTTIASPAFSTNATNELLLAFLGTDDNAAGQTVSSISTTGATLTWTLVRRTNTQRGDAEIWRAFSAAQLSNVTVTATLSQGAAAMFTVVSFAGVDTTGTSGSGAIGATNSVAAASGAPTASLVTTRVNSLVLGVGLDWDAGPARTLGANQTMLHQYLATNVITAWAQRGNNPTAVAGSTATLNDTAPTADRYNLTIVEVLPPGGPSFGITGSVTPSANGSGTTLALSGPTSGSTTADASGNFSFGGLGNGSYTITPSKTGFTFTPASQSVTVNGGSVTGVAFTIQPIPTFSISGAISPAASGSGATLALSGGGTGSATADVNGNFTFGNLQNGTYVITPSKTGFTFSPATQTITVNGANVTGVAFTAQAVPTWSISGTVSPAASGAGTTLALSGSGTGTATADVNGAFSFSGLQNGAYTVTPSKAGFTFSPASQSVTVNGANVTGVAFTAQAIPTFTISGTVSPAANGSGTTLTLSGAGTGTATADASGNFTFSGRVNGTYTITPAKSGFSFSPASAAVTVNNANITGVNFTATAQAAGLSIDVTVFKDQSNSSTTITSPAFSTAQPNELILAFVSSDYISGPAQTVSAMTGGGLTWTLAARTNAQAGTSEVWRAFAASKVTSATVTATMSQAGATSITMVSFVGADATGTNGSGAIGATGSANASSGGPTVTLTTTRNNSWVFGVGNDYDNGTARTLGSGQSMVHQYLATVGDTYWVQRTTAATPVAGTAVTINDTAPTADRWNLTIVEVLPATP